MNRSWRGFALLISLAGLLGWNSSGCLPWDDFVVDLDLDSGRIATWYKDHDQDGFGDPWVTQEARFQPDGYVADSADCDDGDPEVYPGATERCDGIDNDCDDQIDPLWCTCEGEACPVEIVVRELTGQSYGFATGSGLGWVGAAALCPRDLDMHLVVLEDLAEATWVAQAASSFGAELRWWIGLTGQEGAQWTWVDGSWLDPEQAAWAPGEPASEPAGADCVAVLSPTDTSGDGAWSAELCTELFPYVCETYEP